MQNPLSQQLQLRDPQAGKEHCTSMVHFEQSGLDLSRFLCS